jgi:hypothetical protein
MIERLILNRFRGIQKGVIKDIGKINLLVGPNNSGKTTVLEALYWLSVSGRKCGLDASALPEFIDENGLSSRTRDALVPIEKDLLGLVPCSRIWKRHGKPELWQNPPGSVTEGGALDCRIPHLKKDEPLKSFRLIPPPAEEIRDTEQFNKEILAKTGVFVLDDPQGMGIVLEHYLPDVYPDEFSLADKKIPRRFAFTWYPDFTYWQESLGVWGVEGTVAGADCVLFFDFHATGDHFTEDFWWAMRSVHGWRDKLTRRLSSVILDIGEFMVNIEPNPISREVMQGAIEIKGKGTIQIDDFGDGARHAFKVLAGLVVLADRCKDERREGIFLWEDPELFMHSKTLYRLIEEVVDIVKDKPIQVFISTQSLEVIAIFVKILKERPELQEVIRTFRHDLRNGELVTARYTYSNLDAWLESGLDPRFWNQGDVVTSHQLEANDLEDVE